MKMMKKLALVLSLGGLLVIACQPSEEDACSPGMVLDRNYCVDAPSGDGDDASGGSDGSGGDSGSMGGDDAGGATGSGGTSEEPMIEFGDECTSNDECGDPAPFCAIPPAFVDPSGIGICTVECDSSGDGSECPDGWSCHFSGSCTKDE